jgi:polynucleotide 5'-kinase involved in rRNA processing
MAKLIGLTGGIGSGKTTLLIFLLNLVLFMLQTMKQKKLMDSDVIQKSSFDIFGPSVFKII